MLKDILLERFIRYTTFDTQADGQSKECPSSAGQKILADHIAEELKRIGLSDVHIDANSFVTATLPANNDTNTPVIGFIAHLDTSPDMAGGPVNPRVVENYDGKDIILNAEKSIVLSPEDFPELKSYMGDDIVVTDGLTLLGADDKAGISAIISAAEYLLAHPEIKHGKIRLAFTPDEEIGRGAHLFDVKAFGADFAYSVDGGEIGGLEFENFNAANVNIQIKGRLVHPGSAKGRMINALTIASEWQQMLPAGERPEYTSGSEGFYHINKVSGNVDQATMGMLVRDHDRLAFEQRKSFVQGMADFLNTKYGPGTIKLETKDVYYNMREKIEPVMYIMDLAVESMQNVGVTPTIKPIRGGGDGAHLSFMGLPCPNFFTGGHNFHGKYEFLPMNSLQKCTETIIEIICQAPKFLENRRND